MKRALAEAQEGARKALSVKDPKDIVELQIELFQPAIANALAYRRQLYGVSLSQLT